MLEKLENLREELNWFYNRLNRAEAEEIEILQREAAKREKQIAELMRQIGSASDAANFQRQNQTRYLKKLQTQLGATKEY